MSLKVETNRFSERYTDLASRRLGGQTLSCSDDFFAEMENLLKPGRGVFIDDKYTDRGKWMDGWESRRRRFRPDGSSSDGLDHDWCIIKLGAQGKIVGINADTNHFLGNAPQKVSMEACRIKGEPDENTEWTEIVPVTDVQPGSENLIDATVEGVWTHVRFHIYPDGGVARLRVYGDIAPDWDWFLDGEPVDLAYIKNGARPLVCSDMFFSHMENLIMPERGANMGDGWETKRRRAIGDVTVDRDNDWYILQLAAKGSIQKILVDTCHFKGNYPDAFAIEGAVLTDAQAADIEMLKADAHADALTRSNRTEPTDSSANIDWQPIIGRTKLYEDREHTFKEELVSGATAFTHVRIKMYPDGGISRLRLWGFPQVD
jgi:allantoicase